MKTKLIFTVLLLNFSTIILRAQTQNVTDIIVVNEQNVTSAEEPQKLDTLPEFKGGQNGLMKFLANNIWYPEDKIILDYDGTRTLNSIIKAKQGYKLDSVTLISQKYHNERAVYLSDKNDLYAIGYNAAPSHIRRNRIKNTVREIFARPKMFLDVIF